MTEDKLTLISEIRVNELLEKERELKNLKKLILEQDQKRGYPTGQEWTHIVRAFREWTEDTGE